VPLVKEYIPYLIFGIVTGSIYGICAMGLVLTYKTSGVFNFGHGAVCALSAYAFFDLRQEHGMAWPLAAFIVVFVIGPLVGLVMERLAAGLAPVSTAYKIVGTVGLLVFLQALIVLRYTGQGRRFDYFFPQDEAFSLQGVGVTVDSCITVGIGAASAIGLFAFFRYTRLGTAIRGVVDDPQLLDMTGESPTKVRRTAWVIGSIFASASGILFASTQQQVDVNVLSILIVQAFGAATIALFRNLPMCFVGGVIVALAQKLVSKDLSTVSDELSGLDLTIPFLVLFLGLLVIPRKHLVEVGRAVKPRAAKASKLALRDRRIVMGLVFAAALTVPAFSGTHQIAWNVALTQVALFLSLHLLVRVSGQISLGQIGFAAIGASTFAHMLGRGMPWLLALLIAGLICIPVSLIIAVPAIRLSGLYLGLATFGFGIVLNQFFYAKDYMFGFGSVDTERPGFWDMDTNEGRYYYGLLAIAVLSIALVLWIERSRLGRLLRGMADAPVALSTLGLAVNISRTIVFCIAGFLAGISGALYASMFGAVSAESYFFIQSLIVLAVLAISGRRTVVAAIVAPILLYVVPNYITNEDFYQVLQMFFGLAAIFAAIGSQGAFDRLYATNAARFSSRRVGPASVRVEDYLEKKVGPPAAESDREPVGASR
jgi:ABC-type branched-subunit amino acid transport system permease subunit